MSKISWREQREETSKLALEFLTKVFGEEMPGYVVIHTRNEKGYIDAGRWFPADRLDRISALCGLRNADDVYFSVSSFPTESRKSNESSMTRVIYADSDKCDPRNYRKEPSIVLETSPGKYHCFWVLDKIVSGLEAASISAKISKAHASQGSDKHAKDTKILRVPGTTNTKYATPWTVVAEYSDITYSLEEMEIAYADVELGLIPHFDPTSVVDMSTFSDVQKERLKEYANRRWEAQIMELNKEANKGWKGEGWDNVAFRVCCDLARCVNTPWSGKKEKDAIKALDNSLLNDNSFIASGKWERAVEEVSGKFLPLPDWAVKILTVEIPDTSEIEQHQIEDKLDRDGYTQQYVSVDPNGENDRFTFSFLSSLIKDGYSRAEICYIIEKSSAFIKSGMDIRSVLVAYDSQTSQDTDELAVQSIISSQGKHNNIPPFLTVDERNWCISNPTFIDYHVRWVAESGTDASTVYQRTLAVLLLSSVYGDLGFLRDAHDDKRLNVYCMILGDSTHTRKSTAFSRYRSVIRRFAEKTGIDVELANDATTEALNKYLPEYDGKVALMWSDEVQSLLQETYAKKFRAGFFGTLAKVFDGNVDKVLRSSEQSKNSGSVQVTFNFCGIGIRKHVGETLTTANYESGLMPRFVYAIADPPPFSENAMMLPDPDEVNSTRSGFGTFAIVDDIVNDFIRKRRRLGESETSPITLNKEAISRYNSFTKVMLNYLHTTNQLEFLSTAASRFGDSVRKTACLLAMDRGCKEVEIGDMLQAIRQGELWFRDMIRITNEVSSNNFEKQVDDMELFIASQPDGICTPTDLRQRFRNLRNAEYNESITNLIGRGLIRVNSRDEYETLDV